jgi:hypothetical protein
MHIEGRELKSYVEPITSNELEESCIYFLHNYYDEEMLIPMLEPCVFVGRNLAKGDVGLVYFQDLDSYRQGIRYDSVDKANPATFEIVPENEMNHIFTYERALDSLLRCSLRRRETQDAHER